VTHLISVQALSDSVRLAVAGETEKSWLTPGSIPWATYSMANAKKPATNRTRLVRRYCGVPLRRCVGGPSGNGTSIQGLLAADAGEDVLAMRSVHEGRNWIQYSLG